MQSIANSSPIAVKTMTSDRELAMCTDSALTKLTSIILLFSEHFGDLVTNFTVWDLDIILGATIFRHQREETIIGDIELERD